MGKDKGVRDTVYAPRDGIGAVADHILKGRSGDYLPALASVALKNRLERLMSDIEIGDVVNVRHGPLGDTRQISGTYQGVRVVVGYEKGKEIVGRAENFGQGHMVETSDRVVIGLEDGTLRFFHPTEIRAVGVERKKHVYKINEDLRVSKKKDKP